jgi:hypothetical protein
MASMPSLKIRIYTSDKKNPKTTISVPLAILKIALKLIPKKIISLLADKGIDIAEILQIALEDDIRGILAEIEEHQKNEIIIISVE